MSESKFVFINKRKTSKQRVQSLMSTIDGGSIMSIDGGSTLSTIDGGSTMSTIDGGSTLSTIDGGSIKLKPNPNHESSESSNKSLNNTQSLNNLQLSPTKNTNKVNLDIIVWESLFGSRN